MKQQGVLVIGHGSRSESWVRLVDEAVSRVNVPVPVVASFLELVEGRLIADGVRALEREGVERIIAVPLFVASGSTHIDEIGSMLGVAGAHHLHEGMEPIQTSAEVIYCPPMNDHPLAVEIVTDRARELSVNPAEEVLMLVGHGADEGKHHEQWEALLQNMAESVRERLGFQHATHGTLHPDNITLRAREASRHGRTIVVPLFLSEGYFTQTVVPSRLNGIDCVYSGKSYLPHPHVSAWIQDVVTRELERLEARV